MGFKIGKAVDNSRSLRESSSVLKSGLIEKTLRWWMARWEQEEAAQGFMQRERMSRATEGRKLYRLKLSFDILQGRERRRLLHTRLLNHVKKTRK